MISFFSTPYVYQSIFTGLATINHLPTSQESPPHPIPFLILVHFLNLIKQLQKI